MRSLYEKYKIKRSRANERALCRGGSAVGVFRDQRERETGRIRRDSGIKGREPSEHPGKRPECGAFGRMALGARLRNHGLKTTPSEDFSAFHAFGVHLANWSASRTPRSVREQAREIAFDLRNLTFRESRRFYA